MGLLISQHALGNGRGVSDTTVYSPLTVSINHLIGRMGLRKWAHGWLVYSGIGLHPEPL